MKVKKLLIFLLLLMPLFATTPTTSISAEASYYAGTGHWYEVINTFDGTWTQDRDDAEAKGGYLASIMNSGENNFANVLVTAHEFCVYIGANDRASEGAWIWLNGDFVSYTNWSIGEPNNQFGAEDVAIMHNGTGTWGDIMESTSLNYLIEYDSDPAAPEFPHLVFPFAFIGCFIGVSVIFTKKRR